MSAEPTPASQAGIRIEENFTELDVPSEGFDGTVDLTGHVADCVSRSTHCRGMASVCVIGSTASVVVMRYEPGAVADLLAVLSRLAPGDMTWQHEITSGDPNGASHLRSTLLGTSVQVPFADGRSMLPPAHRIVLVDFDLRAAVRRVVITT